MWKIYGDANELVQRDFPKVVNKEFSHEIKHAAEKAKHKENEVREAFTEVLADHVKEWNKLSK